MQKKRLFGSVIIALFIFSSLNFASVNANTMASEETTITNSRNNLEFRQTWDSEPALEERPTPPSVDDIVGNITHYSNPEDIVYTGDDIIPSELLPGMEWVHLQVNLTAMYVWDDHDDFSAGDIFVRYIPNYWIGDPEYNGWLNYQGRYYDTDEYQIEDGDDVWYNFTEPITLCDDWTILSCLYLNVYDYDIEADGDLGYIGWWYEDPKEIEGYHEIWTWNDDTNDYGDACLAFEITILEEDPIITATDLTELFQPYLIDNDDTDYTSDPDGLFARVIQGYDQEIGMGAFCIQYLYYWSEVWTDGFWGDQFIHYDDYELVQIYVNLTYTGGPMAYRFVFDNHDEYTLSNTEWRDSMEYAIYEWGVTESGLLTKEVTNSEELKPLLGEKYTATYEYHDMENYVENYCGCYGGIPSLLLTVETYNHQFAIGNTGGDLLGQYYIEPYTDDIIELCYLLVNDSFSQGVHEINGYTVPDYAPFAYDVLQVFEVPYIHSNFDHLMQQAASFQGDTEANGAILNIERSINVTLYIPVETSIDVNNALNPDDEFAGSFNAEILTDEASIIIDYLFNVSVDVDIFFFTETISTVIANSLVIDFADPVLQFLISQIGIEDSYTAGGDYVDGMLSVNLELTPQLLGTILNCSIDFHVDEILKHYLPQYGFLVDLFFEDIAFTINPVLTGYLDLDMLFGSDTTSFRWESTSNAVNFDFTVPDFEDVDELVLKLQNFTYGLNMKVYWGITIEFADPVSWFLENKEYNLGTWPNLDLEITPLDGEVIVADYFADEAENRWVLSDTCPITTFTHDLTTVHTDETLTFQSSITWGDGPFEYDWDFGDGSSHSTQANPTHVYTDAGEYQAKLVVTDADGDQDSFEVDITVEEAENTDTDSTDNTDPGSTDGISIPGFSLQFIAAVGMFSIAGLRLHQKRRVY